MNKTNRQEVYLIVLNAGDDGISTPSISDRLGVPTRITQQHLWRLAKSGSVVNLAAAGGAEAGLWVATQIDYGGVRDVSDVEQRWLQPGQYRVEIPPVANSVWALAR